MVGQHSHLWRMVWQETGPVAVIVMLTALEPYFPRNFEDSPWTINGNLEYEDGFCTTLSLLEKTKEVAAGSTLRKLSMVVDGEEKIIWHFLFKGWPDLGVPAAEQRRALLRLIKMANSKNSVGPENPLIVPHPHPCLARHVLTRGELLGTLFSWCWSLRYIHRPGLPPSWNRRWQHQTRWD